MSLFNVFDLSGSALHAQNIRLTTISQNIANAESVAGSPESVYKARTPIFQAVLDGQMNSDGIAVKVIGIAESTAEPIKQFAPDNPVADENGFIYTPNINSVEQMSNMMTASRSFQINIEMMNTTKELLLRTVMMGQ
jgi:flagellar basal-body rod protein FlgC